MTKSFFIVLLILFPLGVLGRVELGGGLNILVNDVVVGVVVLSWFLTKVLRKKSFSETSLRKPLLLFAGLAGLSLLSNIKLLTPSEFAVAFLYLLRWISYAGLFFVIDDSPKSLKEKIPVWLLLAGLTTAAIGFVQYFLYPNLRNLFYAGWDDHLFRLFSSFFDPNFAGGILVLTFLLALSFILQLNSHSGERQRLQNRFWTGQNEQGKLFAIFTAVLSILALLLTYSRGSFISFVVGTGTFLWLIGKKKIILLLLAVFAFGVFLLPKDLQSEGVKLFRTASVEARLEEAKDALTLFQKNPVFGVGFNAYRYAKARMGLSTTNEFGDIHSAAGTDNSFLFVLATTGIVGFGAYFFLWFRAIKETKGNPLVLASLFAIFVHAFFVNSLFYPWIMEWLWILLAVSKVSKSP